MSSALEEFDLALAAANALIDLEAAYPDPPELDSYDLIRGLRGGACVMMVAAFEEFLRAAFSHHLSRLIQGGKVIDPDLLPNLMRVDAAFASLQRAMSRQYEDTDEDRLSRLPRVRRIAKAVAGGSFDPAALAEVDSNPNAETVKKLFKRVGVQDPFSDLQNRFLVYWPKPEANSYVRDRLNELVNRRHVVAHTGNALGFDRNDLFPATHFFKVLAMVIDELLYDQIDTLVRDCVVPGKRVLRSRS